MANKAALNKKLSEIKEAKRELGIWFGRMATTPRSDPSYSSAKMDNMQKDLAKLDKEIADLEGQLLAIDQGPEKEKVAASAPKPEPVPKEQDDPELKAATKKAEKELVRLLDQSNKRAIEMTKAIYMLVDQCMEQEKDWTQAVAEVHVNPAKLSAWQVREAFPVIDLINFLTTYQRRITFVRRDLLDKAGLPPVF